MIGKLVHAVVRIRGVNGPIRRRRNKNRCDELNRAGIHAQAGGAVDVALAVSVDKTEQFILTLRRHSDDDKGGAKISKHARC